MTMLAQLVDDHAQAAAQVLQAAADPTQVPGALPQVTINPQMLQGLSPAMQVKAKLATVWLDYGLSGTSHPASQLGKALCQAVLPAEGRRLVFHQLCFPVLCQALLDGGPLQS